MIVRQFLPIGIQEFRLFLAACRESPRLPVPQHLLEDESKTIVVKPRITIESKRFSTRADAAHYLKSALSPLAEAEVVANEGLWSWLSLLYFDEVCPISNGRREVKSDY